MEVGAEVSRFTTAMPVAAPGMRSMGNVDDPPIIAEQEPPRLPRYTENTARIQSIDAARFVAILGIVFIHSIETPQLLRLDYVGTFGVPFYIFASLYFQARAFRRTRQRRLDRYIGARVSRLYVPFLGWSLIYLAARNVKHLLLHKPPIVFEPSYLWTGITAHLWFLPMLTIVTIVTATLNRLFCDKTRIRWTIIISGAMLGTALAVVPRPDWMNHPGSDEGIFFVQFWKVLPAIFLGLALAWWMAWERPELTISPAIGFAGVLMTVMMVADQIVSGYSRVDRTLSGLGWLVAALASWRGAWVNRLARLGKYSYGIYLSHVLFIEAVQALAHSMGYGISLGLDLISITAGLVGAVGTTLLIAKSPALRWLNGD